MKKVAILTQPLHTNYGGTLQAFALQTVIKSFDLDVCTINYQIKQKSILRTALSIFKNFILNRKEKFPILAMEKILIEKNHTDFIEKYINRSEIITSEKDLLSHFNMNNYEAIIIGSDQVWRIEYSPNIDNFFLNFYTGSAKKIAYAASFGLEEWQFLPEKTLDIKKWLNEFDAVSLREDSAVNLCKQYLNINAEHVLDPTLLLPREKYERLITNIPKSNKGIFTYILDSSEEKSYILDAIAKKKGLESFNSQPKMKNKTGLFINNISDYTYPKIEDWIASFRDASFIVTDSFHGTVFSIIFNKPFIAIGNMQRGKARFTSILKLFNLEDRLIMSFEDFDEKIIDKEINYDEVNEILIKLQEKSLNFLSEGLN